MNRYHATFHQEDGTWVVELVDHPQVHTFGRTLAKAKAMIRDATALWFDVAVETIEISPVYSSPIGKVVDATAEARLRAQETTDRAAEAVRSAAVRLTGQGVSLRDTGELLGISHQRVHQLVSSVSVQPACAPAAARPSPSPAGGSS